MSIEEDVKRCKKLIKIEHANWIGMSNQSAISNVLAELEQDKKRIQELEKEKQRYKIAFNQQLEVLKDTVKKLNDSIPTQKVIDKIKEIKEDKDSKYYHKFLHERDIENAIGTLQELL